MNEAFKKQNNVLPAEPPPIADPTGGAKKKKSSKRKADQPEPSSFHTPEDPAGGGPWGLPERTPSNPMAQDEWARAAPVPRVPEPRGPPPPPPKKKGFMASLFGDKDEPKGPPQKKQKPLDPEAEKDARAELAAQILRYADAFPENVLKEEREVTERQSKNELTFILARIQKRINMKQELSVMQSGLVTSCMALEFGTSMIPGQPVKLKGFGTNVASNIQMFDTCLKQIACKYGGKLQMSVETQMIFLMVRIAANTHMTNMMMETSRAAFGFTPGPESPPRQDPSPFPFSIPNPFAKKENTETPVNGAPTEVNAGVGEGVPGGAVPGGESDGQTSKDEIPGPCAGGGPVLERTATVGA